MRPKTATGSATGSRSKIRTLPCSARSNPRMCLIKVVLPAPFSPTRPNTPPRGTVSETSWSATFDPNRRDRFLMLTTASVELHICFPQFLARSAGGQFTFEQPANLVLAQIQRFELVECGFHDRVRLLHKFGPRHDGLADESARAVLQLDNAFMLELSIRARHRVRID